MPFHTEPPFKHGQAARTAVLLCNLGTPDEPTAPALRRYLAEFLGDQRVVEIPRFVWMLILHGIILRVRPKKSAAKYAGIWMPEGSPLKVWTERQATLLRGYLGERGHQVTVRYAMRYGKPSLASVMDELRAEGVTRVLVLPAYPQYSATTTASVIDGVMNWAAKVRNLPELRFINRYHDHAGYIQALAKTIRAHRSARCSWAIPTIANATRPHACWPNSSVCPRTATRSLSSRASARRSGWSPTPNPR
jgi:protoporphyrin/coproporphyrin ferrochelatase